MEWWISQCLRVRPPAFICKKRKKDVDICGQYVCHGQNTPIGSCVKTNYRVAPRKGFSLEARQSNRRSLTHRVPSLPKVLPEPPPSGKSGCGIRIEKYCKGTGGRRGRTSSKPRDGCVGCLMPFWMVRKSPKETSALRGSGALTQVQTLGTG